jgi:tetratricopeptide (TPR) repeat protein
MVGGQQQLAGARRLWRKEAIAAAGTLVHRSQFAERSHFIVRVVLLLLLLALSPALAVRASAQNETISLLDAARVAVTAGDLDAARDILRIALSRDSSSTEARFLLGEVETRAGNFQAAVRQYRAILVDHPELVRVRLDLARALFELHDDEVAAYHFQLALAAPDLPPEVVANIHLFLTEISKRKRYSGTIDIGIAPDTNENVAPTASEVSLFGLPFELSQASKPHSGVGLSSSESGEVYAPLASDLRWRAGANSYSLDYPEGQFDDSQVKLTTGPQLLIGRSSVSLLAVGAKRWYGNDPYSYGSAGRPAVRSTIACASTATSRASPSGITPALSSTAIPSMACS